nr:plasmid pRiA4b ORF-3 family protein [Lysinibacillus timonensis]
MHIQCTKKLLELLNKEPKTVEETNPLISWHANLITINRRKTVVIVNDKNRYVIVLHGLKAMDFNNFDETILKSIRNTFEQECIKDEVIELFLSSASGITYSKTKNKSLVARMNKACETVYFFEEMLDLNTIYQPAISRKVSRDLVGDGNKDYFRPSEAIFNDLEEFARIPIFHTKALELKVTLRLENIKVFRRLIVPFNLTFSQLHNVIQIAFGWQDYHLHEFYIFDNKQSNQTFHHNHPAYNREGSKPLVNLVCDEESFSYGNNDIPMKMDTTVKLSEYMSAKITYIYDFGDNWIHDIEIERVIDDYQVNFPTCIECEGNTPPEDVGGEIGYEVFLEIINDKNHPEHEKMLSWSKSQLYSDFDIDIVNRRLKLSGV